MNKTVTSVLVGIGLLTLIMLTTSLEDGLLPIHAQPENSSKSWTISPVEFSLAQFEDELVDKIATSKRSVVSIIVSKDIAYYLNDPFSYLQGEKPEVIKQRTEIGGGSGIFVHKDGYILTNNHVIEDESATYTVVFYDGTTAEVTTIRSDPLLDIAVVKVNKEHVPSDVIPATILGIQEPVSIGQFTYAIGNTLAEFSNSVTLGIISGKNREIAVDERSVYGGLYQTDTPISMGNSGGPLYTLDGKVIGLNTAISAIGQNVGFALPITQEFVDATLASIQKTNRIQRPLLGVRSRLLTKRIAQELDSPFSEGMYIAEVISGSPAAKAGLQVSDVLLEINQRPIDDQYPLLYQLYTYKPGDTVMITYGRNGKKHTVAVELGAQ